VAAQAPSSATPKPTPGAAPRVDIAVTDGGLVPITAPVVGKFYAAASPSDPPYVEQGAKVAAGTTVGLIEVMKVFTSVKAEVAGVIEQILVPSGDYVEFGQTLFLLGCTARPHDHSFGCPRFLMDGIISSTQRSATGTRACGLSK
jgi:biotin carboxyl carrier protein